MPVITKKKSFPFFPETFLAGTNHLSSEDVGIYWRMVCKIWMFQPDQSSFVDDNDNWMFLTDLKDVELIKPLRKKLLLKHCSLFKPKKVGSKNKLIQMGLFKARKKIADISKINSANARSRQIKEAYNEMSHTRSQESRTDSVVPINLTSLNTKKDVDNGFKNIEAIKKKVTEKNKNITFTSLDKIFPILQKFLSTNQIDKLLDLMPTITLEYITEKIEITRQKKPKSVSGFLYSALINDYKSAPELLDEKKKPLISIASGRPLVEEEYAKLSNEEKKMFVSSEHVIPGGFNYQYNKKPSRTLVITERFIFDGLTIGDTLTKFQFNQLKKINNDNLNYFERVKYSARSISVWKLKK